MAPSHEGRDSYPLIARQFLARRPTLSFRGWAVGQLSVGANWICAAIAMQDRNKQCAYRALQVARGGTDERAQP
jgi:hypothetical protein